MTPEIARRKLTGIRLGSGLWSAAESMAWPIGLLLLAAAITRTHGVEAYGSILIFTATLGFVPLACLGVQTVLIQTLPTDTPGANANERAHHLVWVSLWIVGLVTLGLMVLAGIAFAARTDHGLAMIDVGARPQFAFAVLVGIMAMGMDQVSIGVLKGRFMFRASALLEIATRTAQVVATAVATWWLIDAAWLAVVLALSTFAGSSLRLGIALLRLAPKRPERVRFVAMDILRPGRWVVVQSLGGYPYMGLDRLVVGTLMGAGALGLYGICVQLAQFAHMLPAAFFQPIMPAVSQMRSQGDLASERQLLRRAHVACFLGSTALGLTIALIAPVALQHWLGRPAGADEVHAMMAAAGASTLMGCMVTPYYAALGRGEFRAVSFLVLAAGLIFLVLLVVACTWHSVGGATLSRASVGILLALGFLLLARFATQLEGRPTGPK